MRAYLQFLCLLLGVAAVSSKQQKFGSKIHNEMSSLDDKKTNHLRTSLLLKHFPIIHRQKKLKYDAFEKEGRSIVDLDAASKTRLGEENWAGSEEGKNDNEQHKDYHGEGGSKVIPGEGRKDKLFQVRGNYNKENENLERLKESLDSQNGVFRKMESYPNAGSVGKKEMKTKLEDFNSALNHAPKDINQEIPRDSQSERMASDLSYTKIIGHPKQNDINSRNDVEAGLENMSAQNKQSVSDSHVREGQIAVKLLKDPGKGEAAAQSEDDWKFHFKQRDSDGLPQEDGDAGENDLLHLERREAKEKTGEGSDWKSHVVGTQPKTPDVPVNGTAER